MRTVTVVPAVSVAGLRSFDIAAAVPAPATVQAANDDSQAISQVRLAQPDLDLDLEVLSIPALDAVDGITPKFTTVALTRVGR